MTARQSVLRKAEWKGTGLHTGQLSTIRLSPAPPHTGVLINHPPIGKVCLEKVIATDRRIVLSDGHHQVQTTEHLLAALYGMGISDVKIEIFGPEAPILDGSALPFVRQLIQPENSSLSSTYPVWTPSQTTVYTNPTTGAKIVCAPANGLSIHYHLMFNGQPILDYEYHHSSPAFIKHLAPARTFAFFSELKTIKSRFLILGAHPDCAFVLLDAPSDMNEFQRILNIPIQNEWLYPGEPFSVLSRIPPRFPDEAVRHKILDMLGDFALTGKFFNAAIEAWGTGHSDHIAFLKQLNIPK